MQMRNMQAEIDCERSSQARRTSDVVEKAVWAIEATRL
jgi:hypothetical protein